MQHDITAVGAKLIPCPICGRPLRWTGARWLASFECDRCGQFSDFGDASRSPAQSRHSSRFPRILKRPLLWS
jgi:endogenous inhibitor of DNA gyrase (YacG/DUF329 family)